MGLSSAHAENPSMLRECAADVDGRAMADERLRTGGGGGQTDVPMPHSSKEDDS